MKVKTLSPNNRGMVAMAINDKKKKTKIFLHGVSKTTGEKQWYESKGIFTQATALKYLYNGQYSQLFAQGITKSGETDWI